MTLATSVHELQTLILSFHPVIVVETVEEQRLRQILQSVARQARLQLFEWSLSQGLSNADKPGHKNLTTAQPVDALGRIQGLIVDGIFWLKDFDRHLSDPSTARRFRETADHFAHSRSAIVLSGTDCNIPADLAPLVLRYRLRMPGAKELRSIVESVSQSMARAPGHDAQMTPAAWESLLGSLQGLTLHQARQSVAQAILQQGRLTPKVVPAVLDHKVQLLKEGGLLEYYPAQDNTFELGGFSNLRAWLQRAAMGYSPQAKELGLQPPRGIMLVGVQGCGKSLAAKVIARDWSLPLLKLDMGSLYNKYMGETEKNLRKALQMAETLAPCVLWIDEIEKAIAVSAGGGSDDGVSRRLLGHLLTWLQENDHGIFVVATANDLEDLPPELMRKGRFDEVFFVDLPTLEERKLIFEIHLRTRQQDPSQLSVPGLALAAEGFSGAEIEQAVISGLYASMHQKQTLNANHVLAAIQQTNPLSQVKREQLDALRHYAADRFVPV